MTDNHPERRNIEPVWADTRVHPELKTSKTYYFSTTLAGVVCVLALAFAAVEQIKTGTPAHAPLPCLIFIFSLGWVVYGLARIKWRQYASWVFTNGKRIECSVNLVPSGELDHPFIIVDNANDMTSLHNSRVFSIECGDISLTGYDVQYPKDTSHFHAVAIYDEKKMGNAVVFEINGHRFWCRSVSGKLN